MFGTVAAIAAYTVLLAWYPLVQPGSFIYFVLSWAGAGAITCLLRRGALALIPAAVLGLLMGLLFFYLPGPFWIVGLGIGAGVAMPLLLQAGGTGRALGQGIAAGGAVAVGLVYLGPHVPAHYINVFIAMLPVFWLLAVPALRDRPAGDEAPSGSRGWGYATVMLIALGIVVGVYQESIFYELSLAGRAHHFVLFASFSAGALLVGQNINERGLRRAQGLSFMIAIPLSLAFFGFKASVLTYLFSDLFIGFGLGGATVFVLHLIYGYANVYGAVCLGFLGLGLIAGSRLADLCQGLYGVDMEGIAFISMGLFFAGTLPPMLMLGGTMEAPGAAAAAGAPVTEPGEARDAGKEDPPVRTMEDFCNHFGLSKREMQVLEIILDGKTAKEVGKAIFISESTVKTHVRHIYEKVGVRNKMELLRKVQKQEPAAKGR